MNLAESLYKEIDTEGIDCVESNELPSTMKGLLIRKGAMKVIATSYDISDQTTKTCVIAEELGHYHTTIGDILDQTALPNQKQEKRARRWAHCRLIPLKRFVECYYHGCNGRFEIAEYLDVTEEFLDEALENYKEIYGHLALVDEHVIYFDPLGVMKLF